MKQISLFLLTLCLISCANEPDLDLEITEPNSKLEEYITVRSHDGRLGPNPMIIVDGGLKTLSELNMEAFELNEAGGNIVAVVNKENSEMLRIFGDAASDGIVLIRTSEVTSVHISKGSFNTERVLIVVNGKATHMTDLSSLFPNKIASVHIFKNSSLLSMMEDIGYDAIIQIETK